MTKQCACGCGTQAPIAKHTDTSRGYVKGQARRFCVGHNKRKEHAKQRYCFVFRPNHPRGPVVYAHVIVAESALGRYLPSRAQVHHVDGNEQNNGNGNLVICQDQAYHQLLHVRTRIVRAGGDPNTDGLCKHCGPRPRAAFHRQALNLSTGIQNVCRECRRALDRERSAA